MQLLASASTANGPYLMLSGSSGSGTPQIDNQYPPDNANVTTLTPELIASGHDPDGDSVKYTFAIYSSTGTLLASAGPQSSGDWQVPSGKLAWNQGYFWTVQDTDGTNSSPTPQPSYLSTPVPQPLITSGLSQNTDGAGYSPEAENYTTTATDASVNTTGPALAIERDYNSLDPRITGAFGAAWSSILDMAVRPGLNDVSGNPETMVVTYPDGEQVGFGKNSDGSLLGAAGPVRDTRHGVGRRVHADRQERHGLQVHPVPEQRAPTASRRSLTRSDTR